MAGLLLRLQRPGTDRYPPFSLGEKPDYPARLDITYPQHLSRGLVLVKTWLLALPHYLIVGILVGGAGIMGRDGGLVPTGTGLVGLLVCVAAIALLVRGNYPQGIFDAVLGMDRWALRVTAYAALMTDSYPPFRIDLGGSEPRPSAEPVPSLLVHR